MMSLGSQDSGDLNAAEYDVLNAEEHDVFDAEANKLSITATPRVMKGAEKVAKMLLKFLPRLRSIVDFLLGENSNAWSHSRALEAVSIAEDLVREARTTFSRYNVKYVLEVCSLVEGLTTDIRDLLNAEETGCLLFKGGPEVAVKIEDDS